MSKLTKITSKNELDSISSELLSKMKELYSKYNELATHLAGIENVDNYDLSGAANILLANLKVKIGDVETVIRNIRNYIQAIEEMDKADLDIKIKSSKKLIMSNVEPKHDTSSSVSSGNSNYSSNSGGSANYSSQGDPNYKAGPVLSKGKSITLPKGLGNVYTYMGWQKINSVSSDQYRLREKAGMKFDSEGFGKINGRYVVATTTTFGKVGDYIDVEQEDGTVIKCIIGEIKNQDDSGCNKWGHQNGACVLEFVVDKYSWYGTSKTVTGYHPEWKQYIKKITNRGNYFTK